jgi:hypothetical protein
MLKKVKLALVSLFILSSGQASTAEVTVCVIDGKIKNNPHYFSLPNTKTRLACEIAQKNIRPTLGDMYRSGFRLIQVVPVPARYSSAKNQPSPLLYFEKTGPAAAAAPAPKAPAKTTKKEPEKKKNSGFSLFGD